MLISENECGNTVDELKLINDRQEKVMQNIEYSIMSDCKGKLV